MEERITKSGRSTAVWHVATNQIELENTLKEFSFAALELSEWVRSYGHPPLPAGAIWRLDTQPEFYKKGFARQTLRTVIQEAKQLGIKIIFLKVGYDDKVDWVQKELGKRNFSNLKGFPKTKNVFVP